MHIFLSVPCFTVTASTPGSPEVMATMEELQGQVAALQASLQTSREVADRAQEEVDRLKGQEREIYIAPQSEVSRFRDRPKKCK